MSNGYRRALSRVRRFFWGVLLPAVLILAADQGSKSVMQRRLADGEYLALAGQTFGFRLAANTGAAFGMFATSGPVLALVTFIAIGVMLYYSWHAIQTQPLLPGVFALLLGGAAGNLVDRVRLGHVVDFIYLSFWPTFNLADIAITAGAILLCFHLLRTPRDEPSTSERDS